MDVDTLTAQLGPEAYRESLVVHEGVAYWLTKTPAGKRLMVASALAERVAEFEGELEPFQDGAIKSCPLSDANALALRQALPWLTPRPLALATSVGFGDRLGLATPGHVRALKRVGQGLAPIFAQQSIREMTRTRRTPAEVMAAATWGVFEAGWRGVMGADADHLKAPEDIDRCVAAGFTLYTIDPGAHVDDEANGATATLLQEKVAALPWHDLEGSPTDMERRYADTVLRLEDRELTLEPEALWRAAAKYGRAVAHVVRLYRHLEGKGIPFELEVSVDETATPTTPVEHAYIALELRRLGVRWVSLAPRFVGSFEKGVDYRGDLGALREDLAAHAAIARALGPYKLSLHSGSDKFSVYPLIAEATRGLVHLKTAGTSYLEALRVVAWHAPDLFREILALARERFEDDKASYHISAQLSRVPDPAALEDGELPKLLEDDDARQVLHVTFGSVLDALGPQLVAVVTAHEEAHYEGLARHFVRHLEPFVPFVRAS